MPNESRNTFALHEFLAKLIFSLLEHHGQSNKGYSHTSHMKRRNVENKQKQKQKRAFSIGRVHKRNETMSAMPTRSTQSTKLAFILPDISAYHTTNKRTKYELPGKTRNQKHGNCGALWERNETIRNSLVSGIDQGWQSFGQGAMEEIFPLDESNLRIQNSFIKLTGSAPFITICMSFLISAGTK